MIYNWVVASAGIGFCLLLIAVFIKQGLKDTGSSFIPGGTPVYGEGESLPKDFQPSSEYDDAVKAVDEYYRRTGQEPPEGYEPGGYEFRGGKKP